LCKARSIQTRNESNSSSETNINRLSRRTAMKSEIEQIQHWTNKTRALIADDDDDDDGSTINQSINQSIKYDDIGFFNEYASKFSTITANVHRLHPISIDLLLL
jgi:hypothetical protein